MRLPDYPAFGDPADIVAWANQLCTAIEQEFQRIERAVQVGYHVTNPTTNRSLNESGATLTQVAQVLGTLISDFKTKGILG